MAETGGEMARIKHIAISSQDPDKTAAFYKDVLGLEEVGKVRSANADGYYLSDGNVNMAILNFKNDVVTGDVDSDYSGIHHIGFQVDDAAETDKKLKEANAFPMDDVNEALHGGMDAPRQGHGRNVETKYGGPDGVMIDISQGGWVGTGPE